MTDRHGWISGEWQQGTVKQYFVPSHRSSMMNLSDRIAVTNFLGNPGGNSFVDRCAERNDSEMKKKCL